WHRLAIMDRRLAGARGGKQTLAKYGRGYMAEIGARGFAATVARHWQGDKASYLRFLRDRANELNMGGFVERELNRRLADGEALASMELPVVASPDDDPWF